MTTDSTQMGVEVMSLELMFDPLIVVGEDGVTISALDFCLTQLTLSFMQPHSILR